MSSKAETAESTTKKFGKGERKIASKRASRYYPAEDAVTPKKSRKTQRATKLRPSLKPGTVLILLAGRFRGKRVVLIKHLSSGVLLVTGPFLANGVPLRRVNAAYVIATSTSVNVKDIPSKTVEQVSSKDYFTAEKKKQKAGEEAFFKQGEQPKKKEVTSARANDQKSIDKPLIAQIKKEPHLLQYLQSSFSLRNGDKPHELKF